MFLLDTNIVREIVKRAPDAKMMAPLVASGHNLALQDIWLAVAALARNLAFVTRNRRDFERVGGLKVENWFE